MPSVFEAHQDRLTAATPALLSARGHRSDLVFKQEQPARRARRMVRQPGERGGGARPHLRVGHRRRDGHVVARVQCPMPLHLQRGHRLLGRRASHEHGIHVPCTPAPLPDRANAHEPPALPAASRLCTPHARLSLPRPPSQQLAVRLRFQPAPGLGRRASHEHAQNVPGTPGPLPHRAAAREPPTLPAARRRCTPRTPEPSSPPSPHLAVCLRLQPAPGLGRRASHEHGIHVLCTPGPLPHRAIAREPPALPAARRLCTPRARLSIARLPLSAPGSTPPASTSPWTGRSSKSRTCTTCSMYA